VFAGRFIVYGDFNCPFCHALQQRLVGLDGPRAFEWRMVEHDAASPLFADDVTEEQQALLREEMEAILMRAPDVDVRMPPFRPNTRLAIETYARVIDDDRDAADRLRRAVFGGVWRHGLNVGDAAVLLRLAADVGVTLDASSDRGQQCRETWYAEWKQDGHDRIPTIVAPTGARLRGLPATTQLDLFLRGGSAGSDHVDVCAVAGGHSESAPANRRS
jgi:predicted DsbA family dithiol-disulfide isomerase